MSPAAKNQADPPFTATYSGLVNGDGSTVISGLGFLANDTIGSPPGSYSLLPYGGFGSNYRITYVGGTITITANAVVPSTQPVSNVSTSNSSILSQVVTNQISSEVLPQSDFVQSSTYAQLTLQNFTADLVTGSDTQNDKVLCVKAGMPDSECKSAVTLHGF